MSLRFERLDFRPWGCFEDYTVEFASDPGAVDLVYGPNAAGKSTARRGVRSLLYRIESRTADRHTFDYADLRIGGRLVLNDETIDLVRRKGSTGMLTDTDGGTLPDDTIALALGGLTEDVYRGLFEISHNSLVQGGAELLQGQGEVGASLFAAAAGIATLHDTLSGLDAEADRVFKPRARTDLLHKAFADLAAAQKRMRDATLRPSAHSKMERELQQVQSASDELSGQIRELEGSVRVLERKRAVAPLLARHGELSEELESLVDVPELATDAPEKRAAVQSRLRSGKSQLERATKAVSELDKEIAALNIDEELLARESEITEVHEDRSVVRKAATDGPKVEGLLAEARAALAAASTTIGVAADEVEGLRRPATARRALDTCLREHLEIAERQRASEKRLREAKAQLQLDEAALAEAPEIPDLGTLKAALRVGQKLGSITAQISEADAEARRLTKEGQEACARLSPSPGDIARLRELALPSREFIQQNVDQYAKHEREEETLEGEHERLAGSASDLAQDREELQLAGATPTDDDLKSARGHREESWSAVVPVLDGKSAAKVGVAASFEEALIEADSVADARIAGASQIERAAQLEARSRRLKRDEVELTQRRSEFDSSRETLTHGWQKAWEQSSVVAPALVDALGWLQARDEILALTLKADESAARASMLREQAESAAQILRSRLHESAVSTADDVTLEELIEVAQDQIDSTEGHSTARSNLEAALKRSKRDVEAEQHEREAAQLAWQTWEDSWPERREAAGLPTSATPEAAQEIVRAVDEALSQIKRVDEHKRRIDGIDRDQKDFDTRVAGLCADLLASDLGGPESQRAATQLISRLNAALHARDKLKELQERLVGATGDLEQAEAELGEANGELDALLSAADCEDVEKLPEIEQRAARARELREKLAQQEDQVAQVGEGRFDELAGDAEGFDRDAAAQEISRLQQSIEALTDERDQRSEELGQRKRELTEAEGDVTAVEAAEDIELARTRVRELAVEHAKIKLSAAVVRRAMERYRKQHEGPMLHRANELFTRFTQNAFVQVFVNHDERVGAVLVGRERGGKLKRVPEMSDGTREQLFLALRIAAIERYVAASGPVPVVFDDVFLESDEPRSEQIFKVLGELAKTMQVIVLTHHRYLIELGKRTLDERLAVHELPDLASGLEPEAVDREDL
jgi:uncharacterized protein YhaN